MSLPNYFEVAAHDARARAGDPVEQLIRAAEETDHDAAVRRGGRVRKVADTVAWAMFANGVIYSGAVRDELRKELIAALAEHLYPGGAVDL